MSNATTPPAGARDAVRQVISATIGFGFEPGELQPVNEDDLMRLATALTGKADGGDAKDAARWRYLVSHLPRKFNSDKGYFRWYLPRKGHGFMSMEEAVDTAIRYEAQATQPAAPETTNSTEISSKLVVGNTAAPGMGKWRFTRSDLLGSVVVTYPNGHEVTFRTRDIGAAIVAKVMEDMPNALAAQPAPVVGGDWYSRVPNESRFTASLDGGIMQDNDGPWVMRSEVDKALLSARPGKSTEGDEKVAVDFYTNNPGAALADLRERLSARPGGEAVAWRSKWPQDSRWTLTYDEPSVDGICKEPLYTHPSTAGREDARDAARYRAWRMKPSLSMTLGNWSTPEQIDALCDAALSSGAEGA